MVGWRSWRNDTNELNDLNELNDRNEPNDLNPITNMDDQNFMQMALDLAIKGEGFTSPNPMVGAVVVKNGKLVGSGFHEVVGGPHAEVNAIDAAGKLAQEHRPERHALSGSHLLLAQTDGIGAVGICCRRGRSP